MKKIINMFILVNIAITINTIKICL